MKERKPNFILPLGESSLSEERVNPLRRYMTTRIASPLPAATASDLPHYAVEVAMPHDLLSRGSQNV